MNRYLIVVDMQKDFIDGALGTREAVAILPAVEEAVRAFQKQKGLAVDGIAGPNTLKALGITAGSNSSTSQSDYQLLARIISAEARPANRPQVRVQPL